MTRALELSRRHEQRLQLTRANAHSQAMKVSFLTQHFQSLYSHGTLSKGYAPLS